MRKSMFGTASAILAAGSLFAAEPAPEQIKLQNQYVEYRLSQGEIYRIYVKMNEGVTTIQFPSAITEIAGKNISADGKGTDFTIQAQPGNYYFNVTANTSGATGTLTVTHNRKLYILYLIQSDKEAYASVVFGRESGRRNFSANVVTATPKVTPARLVSLIDIAKKYEILADTHPDTVAGCERMKFRNRYRCGKYDIYLQDATRFEDEDTVIFHVVLDNLTNEEIAYDKHSFSAHAGSSIYPMSVSDASGLMPPKSKTHAWFGITSTPEGGRNNLKADNDWLLALTAREMHTANLQSVRNDARIRAEQEAEARKKLLAEEKAARVQIETAGKMLEKVQKEQALLARERAKLKAGQEALRKDQDRLRAGNKAEENRLQEQREAARSEQQKLSALQKTLQAEEEKRKKADQDTQNVTVQAVKDIRTMCEQTRNAVKTMQEQTRNAVAKMQVKPEKKQ